MTELTLSALASSGSGSRMMGSPYNAPSKPVAPLYSSRTAIDDGQSVLSDLNYIPKPLTSSQSSMVDSTTLFADRFKHIDIDALTTGFPSEESLQRTLFTLQDDIRTLKRLHRHKDEEIDGLKEQLQEVQDLLTRARQDMQVALDGTGFVVLPCKHYVVIDARIASLANTKCPICQCVIKSCYKVNYK
ncbi:hypothetical protein GMRT_14547 [Giardia muris]|uniref:Uncharacterized protein n=1 Tax=Giardia muris TaxID=5742 RepID=A0A4Z1T022_GIAMU|nr:hypothetical protein GMRT_14547 [Giardia muris]|eukprot:TNJ29058.1 hypothetical protein GMRT_14547 [Giardia muris]